MFFGLVPTETAPGSNGKLLRGHFMLIVGTLAHGSVTFFMPLLVWLGLISHEATAVLPWFAVLTLPAAVVLWVVGLIFVWESNANNSPGRRMKAKIRGQFRA